MMDYMKDEDVEDETSEEVQALLSRLTFDGITAEPVDVRDVAAALLERLNGPVDALRLQKLCYYAQARHLADHGGPLFGDPIQAWVHGPVIPSLWRTHRNNFHVTARMIGGDADKLLTHPTALPVIDRVVGDFGHWSGVTLRQLTHREQPWREARQGLPVDANSDREIPTGVIRDYYRAMAAFPNDDES